MNARPLAEATEEREFGGKAVQLGSAIRGGLPVPPGVALSSDVVAAIATGDAGDALASRVADAALLAARGWAAVRSSAVGEDAEGTSFAGQHLTVLGARSRAAILDAIVRVWASGRSASALAYRAKLGISDAPRMAIVIQALVHSDVAGVLFSRNPMTGADERVIEASWGLGEAVVAGLVTPDRFRVDRSGAVLERAAGDKDLAIVANEDGSTREVTIEPARASALCLDDRKLARLHALASRAEQHFGGDQDLEWAFVGDELFLLQRRAITRRAI